MIAKKTIIYNILSWVIAIAIPITFFLTSIRILITPFFPAIEYRTPNFPADQYGFTTTERLHWAVLSVDYLINNSDISFLENLKLPDQTPLYNERELKHMVDVKNLVQLAFRIWYILLSGLVIFGVWAWKGKWLSEFSVGLWRGGWFTVGLIITILIFVFISFNQLFITFHHLFFQGDTWLFLYTDSLIRLFPLRFWQDAFIMMGVITMVLGIIFIYLFRPKYKKP